ncbi:NAM7-nonsense-mediated mRNA decay [Fusarium pseudocircinatum]|uniref:NAM7-nonsense-mediated mRNA decay n=1 Tax=Fusarium pseudocircinatum TaxID=56676 RepID=A0A8H5NU37_9HYPO|nr:NAM7-nonsense-mediated mRNA decay [Fusarium pseudocircinatum]
MVPQKPNRGFHHILLPNLSLDDIVWDFRVPNLPSPSASNEAELIKAIALQTDLKECKHSMILKVQRNTPNRATASHPTDRLMLFSLEAFKPLVFGAAAKEQKPAPDLQPRTRQEVSDYSIKCLRAGIILNGVHYNFYGHSNTQLKSRSCFLMAATREEISRQIESMGDFTKMKTVGKKAKRIGLLFSSSKTAMIIDPDRCEDIPDVETDEYVFTDGCGLIAPSLAQELARRTRIIFRDSRYTPSVFQLRYRGYKGVVTVDPRMKRQKALLKFRKSMKKFIGGDDYSFAVVEHSKPFSNGFLNDESIILLHALGISQETLLSKQRHHFSLLKNAKSDFRDAFRFLSYVNRPDLAERVLLKGLESVKSQINGQVNDELKKMLNKQGGQKCRIFVQKSRLLFGVCDAWDVLKEGECAVKVTMEENGLPHALKNSEIIVIRNPCLHPGDWQKFKVVERPELSHLVDCIVFSTRGRRPAADLMSGGDLDGDTFFVSWDPDLIPSTVSAPALYPGGREPIQFRPITDDDRLVYFAKYQNASLGQVKNLYLDWARVAGPMSAQCQELNRLFSQCVDGNRIKIPEKLRIAPKPTPDTPPFILDVLHDDAEAWVRRLGLTEDGDLTGYDIDAIQLLFSREDVAIGEFESVKLAYAWCLKNNTSLESLLHLFDFNILTADQKAWVLAHVPGSAATTGLVQNALCSSVILQRRELQQFHLDYPGIKWKRTYDSSIDRLATFHDAVATDLGLFQRTLIVFQPDERLSLAIYIPKKIERSQDCVINDTGRLFAFPHSQGPQRQARLSLPTKMQYQLYCDGNVFQLFEKQRGNSWVFIGRPGNNDQDYCNVQNKGDRRRKRQDVVDRGEQAEVIASIALDKFSRGLQAHIGRVNRSPITAAEIYIISNRDITSMRNLDLWLEQIDTTETMPLFSEEPKDYSIPSLTDVLAPSDPSWLIEIVKGNDMSALTRLESIEQYQQVFKLAQRASDKQFLMRCSKHVLSNIEKAAVDYKELLNAMLQVLTTEPTLAITFTPFLSSSRLDKNQDLVILLEASLLPILRAFILSANTMGQLILEPFKSILSAITPGSLSLHDIVNLLELAALTIRSTDLALDLLLDCLQRNASRSMVADPKVTDHVLRNMIAISLDHIEEADNVAKRLQGLYELKLSPKDKKGNVVEIDFRIDATGTPKKGSHVRLATASLPSNVLVGNNYSIDALVAMSETGRARFECLHPLPPYFKDCSWILEDCGPFVTSKSMIDAVKDLCIYQGDCCGVANIIFGLQSPDIPRPEHSFNRVERLNASQNQAIKLALNSSLLCLWGPPGTGKTETIVEMICALQTANPKARVLVTAPTHNAVDNVMRRYIQRLEKRPLARKTQPDLVRVLTEVRKVADDLRKYTCDAMAGQEIHSDYKAMKKAMEMVKRSDTIFTTCIGAGIGLIRSEFFDIVIVDEASQQTEPSSIVPLVKGCSQAILVGDHVQLRPTVNQTALALDFDVSLFERLYTEAKDSKGNDGMRKLMLDTQYRMHPRLCEFSSGQFYEGKLKSGITSSARPPIKSDFPFPPARVTNQKGGSGMGMQDYERAIFINCDAKEMPGQKSKENRGQAELCLHICKLLTSGPGTDGPSHSIVVLTPYTRQAEVLKRMLSSIPYKIEVSSIDGFQGREADIIVFVTVRCNEHREIGFLKDMRRMNVALTRARSALIIVGNRVTLTEGTADEESAIMWKRLLGSLTEVKLDIPVNGSVKK